MNKTVQLITLKHINNLIYTQSRYTNINKCGEHKVTSCSDTFKDTTPMVCRCFSDSADQKMEWYQCSESWAGHQLLLRVRSNSSSSSTTGKHFLSLLYTYTLCCTGSIIRKNKFGHISEHQPSKEQIMRISIFFKYLFCL